MNYYKQLQDNAEANFNSFKNEQLGKTVGEVFEDAYTINFYHSLYDYFLDDFKNFGLRQGACRFFCNDGGEVLDRLYNDFMKSDYASIGSYDDITDFLNNVYETYNVDDEEGDSGGDEDSM